MISPISSWYIDDLPPERLADEAVRILLLLLDLKIGDGDPRILALWKPYTGYLRLCYAVICRRLHELGHDEMPPLPPRDKDTHNLCPYWLTEGSLYH